MRVALAPASRPVLKGRWSGICSWGVQADAAIVCPMKITAILTSFTLSVALSSSMALAQAEIACIADWSQAARVVEQEGLATVSDVSRHVRAQNAGDVVKTVLCGAKGNYVYRLVVRDTKGSMKSLTLDARSLSQR